MPDKQLPIPGLNNGLSIENPLKNNGKPDRLAALEGRILRHELEVSLLKIQLEREKSD